MREVLELIGTGRSGQKERCSLCRKNCTKSAPSINMEVQESFALEYGLRRLRQLYRGLSLPPR